MGSSGTMRYMSGRGANTATVQFNMFGVGNGTAQTLTVYGQTPVQTTPMPDVYKSTVTVPSISERTATNDSEEFQRRCEDHRLPSNKFAFVALGQMAGTIRFDTIVKHGGDAADARRNLQRCVEEAQALKQKLNRLGAEIGM
jgi:hypothetical protein